MVLRPSKDLVSFPENKPNKMISVELELTGASILFGELGASKTRAQGKLREEALAAAGMGLRV